MRTGMFRLGARIVDTFNNIQVKEARTESFAIKDGRQLYNEKRDPPSLSDGVKRLKNRGRGRTNRLRGENVNTVEDFLILLLKDRERLECAIHFAFYLFEFHLQSACYRNKHVYLDCMHL